MGLLCGPSRNVERAQSTVPEVGGSTPLSHRDISTAKQLSTRCEAATRRQSGPSWGHSSPHRGTLPSPGTHSLCLSTTTSSLTLSEDPSRGDAATGNQVCVWVLVPKACPRTFVHYIQEEELGPPRLSFLLKPHGFTVDLFTVDPCWSVPRT